MTAPLAGCVIEPLDHRDPQVADRIHAVWRPAHAQESSLIGVVTGAPLQRTARDIRDSANFHLGALQDGSLAGVIAIGPDGETDYLAIHVLVVHPARQRRGIANALLTDALRRGPGMAFTVTTATANAPALALYLAHGFTPWRHGTLGEGALPMVKLRRLRDSGV